MGGGHNDHHHSEVKVEKSVIPYESRDAFPEHHIEDFKIPDWKIYKVENAPELVKVQKRLASLGLKDNWLRNEVWRYDTQFGHIPGRKLLFKHGSSGMALGLTLAIGTIVLQMGYNKIFGKPDAHDHGHGHVHGGHH